MDDTQAVAQAMRYAEELSDLWSSERTQRHRAEDALAGLERAYIATVRSLARAVELRDDDTGSHAERVTALALALTREVNEMLAANPELEFGFLLHDIGKIGVRDAVLLKPGPLDAGELAEMRLHPSLGEQIVAGVPHLSGVATEVIACHHERWDGGGYPRGLAEEEIPLAARIFAFADAYDAMTHDRPYRRALPVEKAFSEITAGAGLQFDPSLAEAFVSGVSRQL